MKKFSGQASSEVAQLVLLFSQLKAAPIFTDSVSNLLTRKMDWQSLSIIITQNRILSIVYKNLKQKKDSIPEFYLNSLKNKVLARSAFNLLAVTYLVNLLTIFQKQDIHVLPFKGPALSEQIYNDITLRAFSDLDILVNKSDALAAYRLLLNEGLVPQLGLTENQFRNYVKDEDHFAFFEPGRKIVVELHWDISGLYLNKPIQLSDLEKHIHSGLLDGYKIRCLSTEALLVYLCVHGCKDGWIYLEQVCSINELIESSPDIDWQLVYNLSLSWKCKKMVLFGLYLAHRLFNTHTPEVLRFDRNKEKQLIINASQIIDNFFTLRKPHEKKLINRFSWFHLIVRDSLKDQSRYLLRLIFRPTDKEWLHFPLPASLSLVHYFIRPFRLLVAKLRGDYA